MLWLFAANKDVYFQRSVCLASADHLVMVNYCSFGLRNPQFSNWHQRGDERLGIISLKCNQQGAFCGQKQGRKTSMRTCWWSRQCFYMWRRCTDGRSYWDKQVHGTWIFYLSSLIL